MVWGLGFPGGSAGKEPAGQCGFDPWVGKIPWRRKWQPTPVFLPGEFPWTEELRELQSMGLQRDRHHWAIEHRYIWAPLGARMVKNPSAMRRPGFDPWVGKIPWEVLRPGESRGPYNPWGHRESDTTERLSLRRVLNQVVTSSGLSVKSSTRLLS